MLCLALAGAYLPLSAQIAFWQRYFGGSGFDYGKKVILLENGALVVAGELQSNDELGATSHGGTDAVLFQYATQGVRVWEHVIGGSGLDEVSDVIRTRDGGFLLVGASTSADGDVPYNHGRFDAWVVRLSGSGEVIWSKTFGGKGDDRLYTALETSDGRFLIGGESGSMDGDMRSSRYGGLDSWIAKIDVNGSLVWERHYGGNRNEKVNKLFEPAPGNFIAIHSSDSYDGNLKLSLGAKDVWITGLNDFGEIQWQEQIGGEENDEMHDALLLPDGDLVMAGTTFSTSGYILKQAGLGDFWLVRLGADRKMKWSRTFGGPKPDGASALAATPDGGFVAVGITKSTSGDIKINQGYFDAFALKINANGDLVWARTLGGAAKDGFTSVTVIPSGGYLVAGSAELPQAGMPMPGHKGASDIWLVNFGEPSLPGTRPYVTPPLLLGKVVEAGTGAPINARITLTDNRSLDSLASVSTRNDGRFALSLPSYGLLSINAIAPGYLFYGEDLLMDTLITSTQIDRQIQLERIRVGSSLILKRIYFEPGKWELLPESNPELERVVVFLKLNPRVFIQISGHTDNTGEKGDKVELSLNRANAVKNYLVAKGISPNRLRVKGYGMYRPIAPNTTAEGRAKNRRVEFEVQAL